MRCFGGTHIEVEPFHRFRYLGEEACAERIVEKG